MTKEPEIASNHSHEHGDIQPEQTNEEILDENLAQEIINEVWFNFLFISVQ